jgi:hypothetical protein
MTVKTEILGYTIAEVDDSIVDIVNVEHLYPTILSEQQYKGWKFFTSNGEYLSVKAGTAQENDLQVLSSMEEEAIKTKYYLTDEDKASGVAFAKVILQRMLDDVYDKRLMNSNAMVSTLEYTSWSQQKTEAFGYPDSPTPMLNVLASNRGITIEEMVQKVKDAVDSYNSAITSLLASKQTVEQEISACTTLEDVAILMHTRYNYQINGKLAERISYNAEESSTFNL